MIMGRGSDIRRGGGRGRGRGRSRVSDRGSNNIVDRSDTGADESMSSHIGGGIEDMIVPGIGSGNENIPHVGDGEDFNESSQRQVTGTNRTHESSYSSHKTYIVPMGDMFDEQSVMKSISNILKEMFNGSWPTWTKVPKSDRELMWQRFQMMKKGGPVSFVEVYDGYYTKKVKGSASEQPPQYTTKKAENAMVNYKQLVLEKSASIPLNINPDLWEKAIGGKKKGRMFGATKDILHLSSSRTLSSSSSTSQVASADEVQKLKQQLVESQDRERAREAEMKIMQEQLAFLTKAWKDNFSPSPN